jgi:dihydropyrimidinase
VTATGSRRADVAVRGGRIEAVEADLSGLAATAREAVDATGLLVLPGVIDVHTHTRVATEAEPDRFFQDSVAAAFGGTTSFLSFNNPGTGSSPSAARSLTAGLREWRTATEADSAIDYGVSLAITGSHENIDADLPRVIEAGVPTCKAFMVYDFRLPDAQLLDAMRTMSTHGGMLEVHCEDPTLVDIAIAQALQRGNTAPRYHATTRTTEAEAVATRRAIELARTADAPVYVVHLSSAPALEELRLAQASGVRAFAETCPHYLTLDDSRYEQADELDVACSIISPPLRSPADRDALWDGLSDGSLSLVATDHVPDRRSVEKADATHGVSFNKISNGAPGIETLLALVYSEGVGRRRVSVERMVDLLSTTPARLFGFRSKGSIERGLDADIVLFDPDARRVIHAGDLHHTSDYTPYEGMPLSGAVRSVFVRGRAVIRNGTFVGDRGYGKFVERQRPDTKPGRTSSLAPTTVRLAPSA